MEPLKQRLFEELSTIPLIDPHTHINPHAPAAKSLDEILSYHYYTELAHSAGMDRSLLEATPEERVRRIVEYLDRLDNTVQYSWLLEIAQTFFDFDDERITPANWRRLYDRAAEKTSAPDWEDQVLRRSGLEQVFLTNNFDDPLQVWDLDRYVPCLRTDELVFHLGDRSVVERLKVATSLDVGDAGSLRKAIERLFAHFVEHRARACAISLPPDFEPAPVEPAGIDRPFRMLLAGKELPGDERRQASRFVFWTLAECCAEFGLPFDLMIGVHRRVYEAGVPQGQDLFDQRTSLYQYRRLFNAFPQVTFPISVLTSSQNQELASYSWIFPNVVTFGHWWYSNVPVSIRRDAAARLQAVPRTKQIAYYSDAYKLEFCLPKFNMYRRILADILADDFVTARGWSEDRALELGRQVLRGNVDNVFPRGP